MEFLKTLGFDPILLGAQILNFLIIFFLLKKFLYKPVLNMIKQRQDQIEGGLKQATKAQETLDNALEQEKKILTNAQIEAKKMMEEAKTKALEISKEIEDNSRKHAEDLIIQAKNTLEQESKEAESKLTQKITVIASDLLTKSLEGVFSDKDQKQILSKTLDNIKKSK